MFEAAQNLLCKALEDNRIHGYSLAVGRGDKLYYQSQGGGLGDGESPAVTPATRYDLDALTQALVTVPLILLALENGLLSLRDPLSLFTPVPSDKKAITLWHLLTHTSGMASGFLLEQATDSSENALSALLAHPLDAPPGKQARYSGMGYLLLGLVLEQVHAMPLDALAKKHLFHPLALTHTGFLPSGKDIAFTKTDALSGLPAEGLPGDANARFLHGVSGGAGLFSTAEDCGRLLGALSGSGFLPLTPEAVRLMTSPHTSGMKETWGLGLRLPGPGTFFLSELWPQRSCGLMSESGSAFSIDISRGIYAVVLCNRVNPSHENRTYQRFISHILTALYAQALRLEAQE